MSSISYRKGQIVGPISEVPRDILFEIESGRGIRRFIIITKPVYGTSIDCDSAAPLHHGSNFKQSYLRLSDTIVGSLLEVTSRWCKFNRLSVAYSPPNEVLHTFNCPTESQSGGLLVFHDNAGSFFAVPAKVPESSLLVTDKD